MVYLILPGLQPNPSTTNYKVLPNGSSANYRILGNSYGNGGDNIPNTIPNITMWLRADQGITVSSGSLVQHWADITGNTAGVYNGTPANQPTLLASDVNGLPAVQFGSVAELATNNGAGGDSISENFTMMFVCKVNTVSGTQYQTLYGNSAGVSYIVSPSAADEGFGIYCDGNVSAGFNNYSDGKYHVLILSSATSSLNTTFMCDGLVYTGTGTGAYTANHGLLGSTSQPMLGNLAEFAYYDRPLSIAEMQALTTYAMQRYNIPSIITPNQVAGMKTWYRSDLGTTVVSGGLTVWADQSGNGNSYSLAGIGTTSAPAYTVAPVFNGHPGIAGISGGSTLEDQGAPSPGTSGTFVCEFSKSSLASSYLFASFGGGNVGVLNNFTSTELEWFNGSGADRYELSSGLSTGLHQLIVSQVDGVSFNAWIDGILVKTAVPTFSINHAPTTIFGIGSGSNGTNGNIVEFIMYDVAITAPTVAALHNYAQYFWANT